MLTKYHTRFASACFAVCSVTFFTAAGPARGEDDPLREIQKAGIENAQSPVMYWGTDPHTFSNWTNHSNRLIPVYAFGTKGAGEGIDLESYQGEHSPYRSEAALKKIYGRLPEHTLNPNAEYFDQSNIGEIQKTALDAGKKYIFLVVFDGMDWQTTFAAATYKNGKVAYHAGRGTGLYFQDYAAGGTTQFGQVVTSPHDGSTKEDVNTQRIVKFGGETGGYDANLGGPFAWSEPEPAAIGYPIGKSSNGHIAHAVPDSAATATALCTGIKTYNGSIGIGHTGERLTMVAHLAQERGRAVGIITSVPISHATPGSAYAHNVTRNDYQDITRDLLGRPSVSHPDQPLSGVDVLIGAGWGTTKAKDAAQGKNFVPGNRYLPEADLQAIDVKNGGRYQVALRTAGQSGREVLHHAARHAADAGTRLFGFFGEAKSAHLPYRTADGGYNPTRGTKYALETYTPADLKENPSLAEMTEAGLTVLSQNPKGFWLMVEAGDVDWANHDNNLDNSIGAVLDGDAAVRTITDWVEKNSNWRESLLIVTADHGHYLHITDPKALASSNKSE